MAARRSHTGAADGEGDGGGGEGGARGADEREVAPAASARHLPGEDARLGGVHVNVLLHAGLDHRREHPRMRPGRRRRRRRGPGPGSRPSSVPLRTRAPGP